MLPASNVFLYFLSLPVSRTTLYTQISQLLLSHSPSLAQPSNTKTMQISQLLLALGLCVLSIQGSKCSEATEVRRDVKEKFSPRGFTKSFAT